MLQVTVLGCGSSLGVPVIGCDCTVCVSHSNYNKRSRSAIVISDGESKILVDFGFDIKGQLIREGVVELDGAFLTHYHADHSSGIDNLKVFTYIKKQSFEIFADEYTANQVKLHHGYLFKDIRMPDGKFLGMSHLKMHAVDPYAIFKIKTLELQLFLQRHGDIYSSGIRIGNFVYSNDVVDFPPRSQEYLYDIDTWVLDCCDYKSNYSHAGMDKVLEWAKKYKPKRIFLTNLSHRIEYEEVIKRLPDNIKPLYDGYKFVIE